MKTCSKCNLEVDANTAATYLYGNHLRLDCPACGAFINFLSVAVIADPETYLLEFGKFAGKTLGEVKLINSGYLVYLSTGRGKVARAASEILKQCRDAEI